MGTEGDQNVPKLIVVMVAQLCEYAKKIIDPYTWHGWIVWNVNYISIKLLKIYSELYSIWLYNCIFPSTEWYDAPVQNNWAASDRPKIMVQQALLRKPVLPSEIAGLDCPQLPKAYGSLSQSMPKKLQRVPCIGVLVNIYQLTLWWGEKKPCFAALCQFPWCKHSHHGQFLATNMRSLNVALEKRQVIICHHIVILL